MKKQLAKLLTEKLAPLGFSGPIPGMDSVSWHAPHFDGTRKEIDILFEKVPRVPGITLHVAVLLSSRRVTEVFTQIGMHGSPNDLIKPKSARKATDEDDICVFISSLNFLMGSWSPKIEKMGDAMWRWKNLLEITPEALADDIFYYVSRQGVDFFKLVDTPKKLADILVELPEFPGRTKKGGPLSSNAIMYAPVFYADAGEHKKAIEILGGYLGYINQKIQQLLPGSDDDLEQLLRIKVEGERVMDWLMSENAVSQAPRYDA
jgi:hypothetical protein